MKTSIQKQYIERNEKSYNPPEKISGNVELIYRLMKRLDLDDDNAQWIEGRVEIIVGRKGKGQARITLQVEIL